jgi:hypothetical protein
MATKTKTVRSKKTRRIQRNQKILEAALAQNRGPRGWRGWKETTAKKFVRLADQAAGRMELHELNLEGDMSIVYAVEMPVPRWPVDGELKIGDRAIFHLHYEDRWRWESPEGWAPLGLLQPLDPFHPNCRPALRGAICLGHLPPNVKPKEIALLGYYTLTLQAVLLDETDPNGVMNSRASDFFRNHPEYVPLTEAGLFEPVEPFVNKPH